MEFGLLGPLLVRCGGRVVPVPRGSQRGVLAALLLASGQAVSVGALAEVLWGQRPPPSAEVTVRNYVRRLRQALGDNKCVVIRTQPYGYQLTMADERLDVSRFETLQRAAWAAARDKRWEMAQGRAAQALGLWRGEALADVESELLTLRDRPRLEEMRVQAAEIWAESVLQLGGHGEAAAELERLAAGYPLREHVHALLMLARYRTGDAAGALAAYADARRVLVGELGVEPGAELRELQRQILARDPALAPAGEAAIRKFTSTVPRELPGAVADFVGRAGELAALSGLVDRADNADPGAVVIAAVSGMAGVGKTALVLCWAHQVAARFADGQL